MPIIATPITNVEVTDSYPVFATATRVYVVDHKNDIVKVYNTSGTLLSTFGGEGSGTGEFIFPVGITGNSEKLAILDSKREDVQLFGV